MLLAQESTSKGDGEGDPKHAETDFNAVLRKLELFENCFLILEAENQGFKQEVAELEKLLSATHKTASNIPDDFEPQEVSSRLAKLEADNSRLHEEMESIRELPERLV